MVAWKFLIFGLARCSKNPYICCSCLLDAQFWCSINTSILFSCSKKIFFRVVSAQTSVCSMPARVCLEILILELAWSPELKIHEFAARAHLRLVNWCSSSLDAQKFDVRVCIHYHKFIFCSLNVKNITASKMNFSNMPFKKLWTLRLSK